jgi:hypothetical protein
MLVRKTYQFYQVFSGKAITTRIIQCNSIVDFVEVATYRLLRAFCVCKVFQSGTGNAWKLEGANGLIWDTGGAAGHEEIQGYTGYLQLNILKNTPDADITITDTTGTLLNAPNYLILPLNVENNLDIKVLDNHMGVNPVIWWQYGYALLDAGAVDIWAFTCVEIEFEPYHPK